MNAEFVDTNIIIYAHDSSAGRKHALSVELLTRLLEEGSGALSIQVLAEFYAAATRKLRIPSQEAEEILADFAGWILHRPSHADLISASRLHRRHKVAWWDALILTSALELGCRLLWSEDLADGQRYGAVVVRNPFS